MSENEEMSEADKQAQAELEREEADKQARENPSFTVPGTPSRAELQASADAAAAARNQGPSAQAGMQTSQSPLRIVDLEDEVQAQAKPDEKGTRFWFGEVQVLKFPDKTEYHITKKRATISDPKLVEKLLEASKNPTNKIFIEE